MNLVTTKTVRELAVEIPGATRVFERLGIDYCCGGNRTLADACETAGTPLEDVQRSLEQTITSDPELQEENFQTITLEELINHIVGKHHCFTRLEIFRLNALLEKVCTVHGDNHPELFKINMLFRELGADLEAHMSKEERVLFPYVVKIEAAARQNLLLSRAPFGTVANPVRMMMMEHDRAGELLKEIRTLSANYTPPADGCISYETLYQALDALEKDLHQHIHLENNILFPRAVEMEPVTLATRRES
ncbi:MAG TPA: iron-sulfur cluster repair di-iron protein [Pyrinomonadaceae bacterium]|nr:iron-sulfur cluster repair di-iron protein [Pyrinomonadaceae bacterium]